MLCRANGFKSKRDVRRDQRASSYMGIWRVGAGACGGTGGGRLRFGVPSIARQ